ncbi:GH92 family glycosyl hydrolase [Flavobacteriales bacterium]|nr:GH92 family glycosyl hydrolase [Flavobacteriales bacterium]
MTFKQFRILALILVGSFSFPSCETDSAKTGNAQYVNPFIGTGGHGHTFPGATRPFGMVQLSPDTRLEGWDGCSGYHNTDSIVYGFSHTHLSGTGVGDYCDILLKPCIGDVHWNNGYKSSPDSGYASYFSKETEVAEAGFYSVELQEGIKVELTTTERAGFHRYIFENAENAHIIIDLEHRDMLLNANLEFVNDSTVRGFRRSKSWAEDQNVFFYAIFSKPFESKLVVGDYETSPDTTMKLATKAALKFNLKQGEEVLVKVGISAVDLEGAKKNLEVEIPDWDFDQKRKEASDAWNTELAKIDVNGEEDDKIIFYSALYHTMVVPNLFSDVDGRYRKMLPKDSIPQETKIGQLAEGENQYTIFSLWDTYRAAHPLYTIIDEKRTNEYIRTFLRQYQDGHQLPVWELAGYYTGCMIGYHSAPVIADAYLKGIDDWDASLALEAMQHSATMPQLGLPSYLKNGFIPTGDEPESVSKTLEYAYDDWCISEMAKALGKDEVYDEYLTRAQSYKNLYNPQNGFLQGRRNGGWYGPFVPEEVNFNYTEANGWQYSLAVPQDVSGLIELMGGDEKFISHLDNMFTAESETEGRHQVDITGLIGQYAHGNEPSHHMAYLYNYAGQPWKTQERVSQILETMYQNSPDGLSGNEDCGQMSAWYVLSSMGFYPVCPGSNQYVIGTPLFDDVSINLENGKQFKISRSRQGKYVQSATLNGQPLKASSLTHEQISAGGKLEFQMGKEPNKSWGIGEENQPTSSIKDNEFVAVPSVSARSRTFEDSLVIEIAAPNEKAAIIYSLQSKSGIDTNLYYEPFTIHESTVVSAIAISKEEKVSKKVEADFKKIKGGRSIVLKSEYSNQYSAGGDKALIDQLRGGREFRTGEWQGYREDLEAIVDLGEPQNISSVSLSCLQDIKSWIFFPKEVSIHCSKDGNEWTSIGAISTPSIKDNKYGAFTYEYNSKLGCNTVRFIKVKAKNYGKCPAWHLGAGGTTWLFVDELMIN